jgi:serine/threonine protein kinase
MLGKSFNAKLCDFGLVKQISNSKTSRSTDSIRGTKGYVDPAYANTGRACEKNDIYSFGIVMLEVVCCERPSVTQNGDRIMNNLVEKVRACHQRNAILDAADRRLRGQSDEQLKRMLIIGLLCVHPDPDQRPHTRKVLEYLTSRDVPLPFLPTSTNYSFPMMNESRSYSSTSHNRSVSEDEFSTSSSMPPQHSGRNEDAGTAAFLTSQS